MLVIQPLRVALVALVVGAFTLAGCVTVRPRAQVVIDIIAEPGIAADARSLLVTVRGGPSSAELTERLREVVEAPISFPVSLTIVPEGEDVSRVFEVVVVALDRGGGTIGRQSMRGRFLAQTTTYVQLVLEDCCRALAPTCASTETCAECECVPTVIVDPNDDAGTPLLDAAQIDAGPSPDADLDADLGNLDVGTDASGCSTTSPCPSVACNTVECVSGSCVYTPLCGSGQVCCGGECASNCDCFEQRAGHVCRRATDLCDVAETCNGRSPVCPVDSVQVAGAMACRVAASDCDLEERCDGLSAACPLDRFRAVGEMCSTGSCNGAGGCSSTCVAGGACSVPGMPCAAGTIACTGGTPSCVVSGPASSSVVCRPVAGPCDVAETCTGSSMTCPVDGFRTSGTCRDASGPCDAVESCNGSGIACPADGFLSGTACRAIVDECDRLETCTGTSATCPPDTFEPAGTACGLIAGDPDCSGSRLCTGTSVECPSTDGQACRCEGTCNAGHCSYGCSGGGGFMCCESTGTCTFWSSGDCPAS